MKHVALVPRIFDLKESMYVCRVSATTLMSCLANTNNIEQYQSSIVNTLAVSCPSVPTLTVRTYIVRSGFGKSVNPFVMDLS